MIVTHRPIVNLRVKLNHCIWFQKAHMVFVNRTGIHPNFGLESKDFGTMILGGWQVFIFPSGKYKLNLSPIKDWYTPSVLSTSLAMLYVDNTKYFNRRYSVCNIKRRTQWHKRESACGVVCLYITNIHTRIV